MGRDSSALFNLVTAVFLALSIFVCLCTGLMVIKVIQPPGAFAPRAAVVLPPILVLPSPTNTLTPSNTFTPTRTKTPTNTRTPSRTPTVTSTATFTPSATNTATITLTASPTPVPSKTPLPPTATKVPPTPKPGTTAKPTATPKQPTVAPTKQTDFPFIVQQGSPVFIENTDATGCQFQGIAGQIFDQNLQPLPGLLVSATAIGGFSGTAQSGTAARFGTAGWLITVDNKPNNLHYFVQVKSLQGVALSAQVDIGFPSACNQNLAVVNFIQTRPY